jgi:lipopolysaccharide transport system permease protein
MGDYKLLIKPKYGLLNVNWQELKEYHEILLYLALKEIKVRYKQTVIGAGWAILQPFLTMVIFTMVFGRVAQMPTYSVPYPIFAYSGLLLWTYFSNALSQSTNSLADNVPLLTKVYVPRLFIPMAPCLSGLLDYIIAFTMLILISLYYKFTQGLAVFPSTTILLLPIIVILTVALAMGVGFWLSSICVRYRDVKYATPFFIQLTLFISPVIYQINTVGLSLEWRFLLYLNPLVGLINAHRACVLNLPVDYVGLVISAIITIIVLISGIVYLKNTEKYFADLV